MGNDPGMHNSNANHARKCGNTVYKCENVDDHMEMYRKAADYINSRIDGTPGIAVVLGSGLGPLADSIEQPVEIDYRDIPGFPKRRSQAMPASLSAGSWEAGVCSR